MGDREFSEEELEEILRNWTWDEKTIEEMKKSKSLQEVKLRKAKLAMEGMGWTVVDYPVHNPEIKNAGYAGYPDYAVACVKGDRAYLLFKLYLTQTVSSDHFLEHIFDFLEQHKDKTVLADASEFPEQGVEGNPYWSESRLDQILAAMIQFPNLRIRTNKHFYDKHVNYGCDVKGTSEEYHIVPVD